MAYHFKNLVFEGGGVKGIAYVGAMEVFEETGIMDGITRVGGTSAGAINAVLVALNYTPEETKQILWDLDFNNFKDGTPGFFRDIFRLVKRFGWYKGDFFRQWICDHVIAPKTGDGEMTFAQITALKEEKGFKDLYVVGTNLSTHFSEVFSAEKTPDMKLADAVRISMSIPLFFASFTSPRQDVYVDGGVLANYPVKLFDRRKYIKKHARSTEYYDAHNKELKKQGINISDYVFNKETLGFRLDSKQEIGMFRDQNEPVRHPINGFPDYAKGLVWTMIEHQNSTHLHSDDWQRTIYIDASIAKTTEFDLADEKKKNLVAAGREGVKKYLTWYDKGESVNKADAN